MRGRVGGVGMGCLDWGGVCVLVGIVLASATSAVTLGLKKNSMQDFPSIGDLHSTVPVPREKWFEYAGERSGRFQVCPSLLALDSTGFWKFTLRVLPPYLCVFHCSTCIAYVVCCLNAIATCDLKAVCMWCAI